MKTPNLKTLAITVAVTAVVIGYLIKSANEAPAAEKKSTIAARLGLVAAA